MSAGPARAAPLQAAPAIPVQADLGTQDPEERATPAQGGLAIPIAVQFVRGFATTAATPIASSLLSLKRKKAHPFGHAS